MNPRVDDPQSGFVTELSPGRLYALQHPMRLDGRISAYPSSARGWSVVNCYLLVEDGAAMLVDTGYAAHEPAIARQIERLIGKRKLSLFPLRLNEFMSIQNVETLAARFDVEQCYTSNPDAAWWFDFGATSDRGTPVLDKLKVTAVAGSGTVTVGSDGQRVVDAFQAPLRLIATRWIYDRATRTLMSSDSFTHIWRDRIEGPWTVDAGSDTSTADLVRSFLLNTRYWWIEGVNITPLREGIAEVFESCDIETLAPGYGAIIRGREAVRRAYETLDGVLAGLDRSRAVSRYVDRDEER